MHDTVFAAAHTHAHTAIINIVANCVRRVGKSNVTTARCVNILICWVALIRQSVSQTQFCRYLSLVITITQPAANVNIQSTPKSTTLKTTRLHYWIFSTAITDEFVTRCINIHQTENVDVSLTVIRLPIRKNIYCSRSPSPVCRGVTAKLTIDLMSDDSAPLWVEHFSK